jgi:hypothetical protein
VAEDVGEDGRCQLSTIWEEDQGETRGIGRESSRVLAITTLVPGR